MSISIIYYTHVCIIPIASPFPLSFSIRPSVILTMPNPHKHDPNPPFQHLPSIHLTLLSPG